MVQQHSVSTAAACDVDETAWQESTADLIRSGQFAEIELDTLADYLTDMARRDRREVYIRLVVSLSHLLKWEYQPDHRLGNWRGTILEQQRELRPLLESGKLHNHAFAVFADAYTDACKQAAAETGLARAIFPDECGWELDGAFADWEDGVVRGGAAEQSIE